MTQKVKATIRHSPLLLGASMLALAVSATALQAQTRIAVLAEKYSETSATQIATEFAHIFEQMQPGDSFIGVTPAGTEVFSATLPNEEAYKTPRLRDKALAPAWGQLLTYFKGAITTEAHDTQVAYPLALYDALRYRASPGTLVAFYGNPLWDGAPTYAPFALTHSFPNDSHIGMDRATTPYGTSGDTPLKEMVIHYCVTEGVPYLSGAHEEGVKRTYALMADAAGAKLATFSADIAQCTRRFASGDVSNAPSYTRDLSQTKFGMISGEVTVTKVAAIAPANASPELAAAIQSGTVEMVRLRVFDSAGEDGDKVTITAPGYSKSLTINNAGEVLDVPLVRGAMMLRGDYDGGGGITVSVALEDGSHLIDGSMSVGEEIALAIPQNAN